MYVCSYLSRIRWSLTNPPPPISSRTANRLHGRIIEREPPTPVQPIMTHIAINAEREEKESCSIFCFIFFKTRVGSDLCSFGVHWIYRWPFIPSLRPIVQLKKEKKRVRAASHMHFCNSASYNIHNTSMWGMKMIAVFDFLQGDIALVKNTYI